MSLSLTVIVTYVSVIECMYVMLLLLKLPLCCGVATGILPSRAKWCCYFCDTKKLLILQLNNLDSFIVFCELKVWCCYGLT